jgi:hypothetical protein
MTYLLPPNLAGHVSIDPRDSICKNSQQVPNQTAESPLISASRFDSLLLMYQENGHVTKLKETPGKATSGKIFVYGTNQSLESDEFLSIHHVWTKDGSGGDGRGQLLTETTFDDGSCYQINDTPESVLRRSLPQRAHLEFEGENLWCGVLVTLPEAAAIGSLYTLYWVWDWPTTSSVALPQGKMEVYTTCLDVLIR